MLIIFITCGNVRADVTVSLVTLYPGNHLLISLYSREHYVRSIAYAARRFGYNEATGFRCETYFRIFRALLDVTKTALIAVYCCRSALDIPLGAFSTFRCYSIFNEIKLLKTEKIVLSARKTDADDVWDGWKRSVLRARFFSGVFGDHKSFPRAIQITYLRA